MECVGQLRPPQACNLLGVPDFNILDVDEDEGDFIAIRPKCSPLPRRKSSITDEDLEPDVPLCGSRRVSFADAKGLSLVEVKEFDTWEVSKLPGQDASGATAIDGEEYYLSPLTFSLTLSSEEVFAKVLEQKIELETIDFLPGTTILKGVIRVLNISYSKAVFIRTTLDQWATHFDLLAEYIPGSSDGVTDCFSFRLTVVPWFREQGARVEFCLRYETPEGTFWANNNARNYVLLCHRRIREDANTQQKENLNVKSCLKNISLSTVENVSSKQPPLQDMMTSENSSLKLERRKTSNKSDGQAGPSAEEKQKLLMEDRQNRTQRRHRTAERMDRVRNYFAQRDADDTDRHETPLETKQASQEGNSVSEGSEFVFEASEKLCEPVLNGEQGFAANKEVELSKLPSAGGERVEDTPKSHVDPLNDPAHLTEKQILKESVTERSCQDQDNTITESRESFTFTTVVAPLYQQVFGRLDADVPSAAGVGKQTKARMDPSERRQTECKQTVDGGKLDWEDAVQSPAQSEQRWTKTRQSPQPHSADLVDGLDGVNGSLDTDLLSSQTKIRDKDSDGLQGEAQEDDLTHDRFKAIDGALPAERACLHVAVNAADRNAKIETRADPKSLQRESGRSGDDADQQSSCDLVEVTQNDDLAEIEKNKNKSSTKEDLVEEENDSNSENSDLVVIEISSNSLVSKPETDFKNVNTIETETFSPLEDETKHSAVINILYEVAESMENKKSINMDAFEETLEENEQNGMTDSSKQDGDFYLAEINVVKNWEMMVEEEENNTSTNDKDNELIGLNAEECRGIQTNKIDKVEEKRMAAEMKAQKENNAAALERQRVKKQGATGVEKCNDSERVQVVIKEHFFGEKSAEEKDFKAMAACQGEEETKEAKTEQNCEFEGVLEWEGEEKLKNINNDKQNSNCTPESLAESCGEKEKVQADMCADNRNFKGPGLTRDEEEEVVSVPGSNKDDREDKRTDDCTQADYILHNKDGSQCVKEVIGRHLSEEMPTLSYERNSDLTSQNSSSAESDSDDEVELYMFRLRAVGTTAQAGKDKVKEAGFPASKRASASRARPPSPVLPPICESVDEEHHNSDTQENPYAAGPSQDHCQNVLWCISWSNVSKSLLYVTLLVVFLAVANQYDFLACFGLYLISVVWLWCQGEKQAVQNNKKAAQDQQNCHILAEANF
ncbi:uncharacterized protein LOC105354194 isoform X1 [Oryzias latipes]|uniref:CBM21 domain-containing protein n=1 Tax=Oryzias latipes TaxID=8090 RepID=A0A3B3HCN6_ORYLA|nr:uncharacterized protein LOC105354194 isoform X1 [Oryzias latipes]